MGKHAAPTIPKPVMIAGALIMLVAATALGASLLLERQHHRQAAAEAIQRFAGVRAAVVKRLNQGRPIELGAVWATHTGRICGLVNGEGSFGGLTGMTPFYTDGPRLIWGQETDPGTFGKGWIGCGQDMWIKIVQGSIAEGYCATRAGAKHCYWTAVSRRKPD